MPGEVRQVTVDDKHAAVENTSRPKADPGDSSQVGAPMSGVVVEIRVHDGTEVKKGDPIAVLSAMKMVSSNIWGDWDQANSILRKWSFQHLTLVKSQPFKSRKATPSEAPTLSVRLRSDHPFLGGYCCCENSGIVFVGVVLGMG